jgi:hypothetical protein
MNATSIFYPKQTISQFNKMHYSTSLQLGENNFPPLAVNQVITENASCWTNQSNMQKVKEPFKTQPVIKKKPVQIPEITCESVHVPENYSANRSENYYGYEEENNYNNYFDYADGYISEDDVLDYELSRIPADMRAACDPRYAASLADFRDQCRQEDFLYRSVKK